MIDAFVRVCGAFSITSSSVVGSLPWHPSGSKFNGHGYLTKNGCPFSYTADWEGPAAWKISIKSRKSHFHLKPFELLTVTDESGMVQIFNKINYSKTLKPGLAEMIRDFVSDTPSKTLPTLRDQAELAALYEKISGS